MAAVVICSEGHQLQAQHICARCQCSVAEKNHLDERKAAEGTPTWPTKFMAEFCVCVCLSAEPHTGLFSRSVAVCVTQDNPTRRGDSS